MAWGKPNPAETGIKTVYFVRGRKPIVRKSKNANRAVTIAVGHMQINQYGAHLCEVYNAETGELYAALKRHANGSLTIAYHYDTRAEETRYSLAYILSM